MNLAQRISMGGILAIFFLFVMSNFSAFAECRSDGYTEDHGACFKEKLRNLNEQSDTEFKKLDAEMNLVYQQKMTLLQGTGSKSRLRDAQRAWLVFRDKSCQYEAGEKHRDESILDWQLGKTICLSALTKERNKQLQEYLECTQEFCPN